MSRDGSRSAPGSGHATDRDGSLRVRPSGPGDHDLLVRHRQGMWTDIAIATPAEIDAAGPEYREWMLREIAAGRFHGFVAEDSTGGVAGSGVVWLQPVQPRPGRLAGSQLPYIMSMYTEPEFRRRGVATRLVEAMIGWARERKFPWVTLHASSFGYPVYRKLGFEDSNEMRFWLMSERPGHPPLPRTPAAASIGGRRPHTRARHARVRPPKR
jgi:GNAT superfamily N-acetyltransferase